MQQFGLQVVHADASAVAEWRKLADSIYPKMRGAMVPPDFFDEVVRLRNEYRKSQTAAPKPPAKATIKTPPAAPSKGKK